MKDGKITEDYAVPCLVTTPERAVAISLAENSARQALHPADEFTAFRSLIDAGRSIEEVAAHFGVTPLVVRRRLKLANVSPRFIALYREGKVTLEHLMAFAVTDDHERQQQAWESLKSYERHPDRLRHLLTQGDISMSELVARFVGVKAYQKAGGVVRRDLFAEDDDTLLDAALVRSLATEKLEKHAAKLRAEGIAWVETHLIFDYATRAAYDGVRATLRARNEEEQRELDTLRARREELQASISASEGETEEHDALLEQLDAVWRRRSMPLDDQRTVPDPEQQALAGAVVFIGRDGKVAIERDLLKAEDAERFAREQKASERKSASEAPRVHSAVLIRRLTAQRTLALQAELVQQPMTAVIALTHRLLLSTLYDEAGGECRADSCGGRPSLAEHAAELDATAAQETLTAHRNRHVGALPSDPTELLSWLTAQSDGDLLALLGYCIAVSVDGVQSSEGPCALDALARIAKLDMRRWWQPRARNYFGSVPKERILAAVTEGASATAAAALGKLKKAALAEAAERELADKGWLPALMRAAG